MIHEVGLDATYEDLQKFAMNILAAAGNTGSQFKDIDIQNSYWNAAMQVLLTRKIDVALGSLASTVAAASKASAEDAAAATAQAKRMVRATWGLVVVTAFLATATAFLVVYTRELVSSPPTVITVPGAPKVNP